MTFTMRGTESVISASVFPPCVLEENKPYYIGLIDLEVFNSIPNVDETNNLLHYGEESPLVIPTGCYELDQINEYVQSRLGEDKISITTNHPTQQTVIHSKYIIDFSQPNSIGSLLGFSPRKLSAKVNNLSDRAVQITKVNVILVDCNLASGSYLNGQEGHTIHQFAITTPPGYKLVEVPANVIYLPVKTKYIDNITVKVTDQNGNPVNLRNETITIRLHLKHGLHF